MALKSVLRLYSQSLPWSLFGAALDADVEDRARGSSVFSAVVVRLYTKLADGVGRGLDGLVGVALV